MSLVPTAAAQRAARVNQRATVRYRCAPATSAKLTLPGDEEYQRAWVINISKKGVGMLSPCALPKDAIVVLQMRGVKGPVDLAAQVVHATLHNQTEWVIGCELIQPLDDDQLDALL